MSLPVADRLDILDVVTRADEAASRRDAHGYVALLIVDPVPPVTIRTAAAITQRLRREAEQWRIAQRTVSDPPPGTGVK